MDQPSSWHFVAVGGFIGVLAGGGCRGHAPETEAVAIRREEDPLGFLPANVVGVVLSKADQVALIRYAETTLGDQRPPCWNTQLASIDGAVQVVRAVNEPAVNVLRGRLDRDSFEQCLSEVLPRLGFQDVALLRDGSLTQVSTDRGEGFLGWSDGLVVFDDERVGVREFLSAPVGSGGSPQVGALLARTDPDAGVRIALAQDYAEPTLGVRSEGLYASFTFPEAPDPNAEMRVTLVFADDAAASAAVDAFQRIDTDDRLPEPLRQALGEVAPDRRENEVTVSLMPLVRVPGAVEALQGLVSAQSR